MIALATMAVAFTSCEDVPMPYNDPSSNSKGQDTTVVITPTGTGTADDPFNVASALAYIDAGVNLDQTVYVKGIVTSISEIDTGTYGNATYYISDDAAASNSLEVYRGYALGNKHFTSEDELKVGDEVVVCGKLVNYNGSRKEFTQGSYVYSRNGETGGGGTEITGTPEGEGTQAKPYNVAAAQTIIANGTYTTEKVYVAGTVSSIGEVDTGDFGNATYFISDDGTSAGALEVYRGYYLKGEKFTSADQLKVGDKVVVYGQLTMFYSTPEITQGSQIYSLNGKTGDGGDDDNQQTVLENVGTLNGNTLTLVSADLGIESQQDVPVLKAVDGTTVTFKQGEGTNAPKYYSAGAAIRMYAKNLFTVSGTKKVASIVLNCVDASRTGNEQLYAQPGTVTKDGAVVTVSGIDATSVDVVNDYTENKAGTQLRIVSMVITYAE